MKLRKNKSKMIPGIVACCSLLIAVPCSAAGLSTNEPIDSIRQSVVGSPHQPGNSTAYQYTGVESVDVTKIFQKIMRCTFDWLQKERWMHQSQSSYLKTCKICT